MRLGTECGPVLWVQPITLAHARSLSRAICLLTWHSAAGLSTGPVALFPAALTPAIMPLNQKQPRAARNRCPTIS
ncbi:hypothetical protein JL2886_00709 [Phaeobacter gallaeciensis]|uniref:Uncharacterized protein n=1 Tax=Phaeobacter gallaeciensis TaxID=60890 RepID=A0A1B0ZNB1_9RHOB|nr:hypothetical protein JL2886_00709 [Phaeobacter gallaeciensis]